jgi:hypothetical protein
MSATHAAERERYWAAVNDALDAGTDPLSAGLVQEWIAAHPEDGDELARMLQRVESVTRARRTAPRRAAIAAAGIVLAGIGITAIAMRPSTQSPAAPPPETRSCILQYSLEIVREGVDSSSTVLAEPGRTARRRTASIGATTIVCSLEGNLP